MSKSCRIWNTNQ